MRRYVPKHPEGAAYQISKTLLLAAVTLSDERIDRKQWRIANKRTIDENIAVIGQACSLADFLSNAFYRIQYRMKIVVGYEFGATKP